MLFIDDCEPAYVSPEETHRRERVAVGRLCRCGDCLCCDELRKDREMRAKAR